MDVTSQGFKGDQAELDDAGSGHAVDSQRDEAAAVQAAQRRQATARRALIAALKVGDEVITAGGIYGTIVAISDDDVLTVQVAPGVELQIAREAIARRRGDDVPEPTVDLDEDDASL